MRIKVNHLLSSEVDRRIRGLADDEPIDDATAVTIASWWQGPRDGKHLAAFASGAEVSPHDLREEVDSTIADHESSTDRDDDNPTIREEWQENADLLARLRAWVQARVEECDCSECQSARALDEDADRAEDV